MASYSYRCKQDGEVFDRSAPIGTAADREPCPSCGAPARRLIGVPMLSLAPSAFVRAHDAAARSADKPEVVTSLPPGGRRQPMATGNPALQRLPRP